MRSQQSNTSSLKLLVFFDNNYDNRNCDLDAQKFGQSSMIQNVGEDFKSRLNPEGQKIQTKVDYDINYDSNKGKFFESPKDILLVEQQKASIGLMQQEQKGVIQKINLNNNELNQKRNSNQDIQQKSLKQEDKLNDLEAIRKMLKIDIKEVEKMNERQLFELNQSMENNIELMDLKQQKLQRAIEETKNDIYNLRKKKLTYQKLQDQQKQKIMNMKYLKYLQ